MIAKPLSIIMHLNYQLYYQNNNLNKKNHKYSFVIGATFIYVCNARIYLLAGVDITHESINFLYSYYKDSNIDYSYALLMRLKLFYYNGIRVVSALDVFSLNDKAISLYIWLGYMMISQINNPLPDKSQNKLILYNQKMQSKNFWRRCLILKYVDFN